MRGHPCELRDGRFHERSEIFRSGEFVDEQLPPWELRDERERRKKDRVEKHLMAFSVKKFSDGELVELEDESRNAPAKSERRVPEWRTEDATVPSVLVSALAILFVCEADARLHQEKFREFVNLRRELPADLRSGGCAIIFLRAIVFLRFDLRAIFRSQNVRVLEIFFGVNVLGALLLFLLAGAFLASGFGDTLILLVLRAKNICAESCETQK